MSVLSKIEAEDVGRLNSLQLVQLLNILLHCEARSNRIQNHGIHVPTQIDVADGGNDGEWNSDRSPCAQIPKKLTIFQCKAQELSPAQCEKELVDSKGALKSEVDRALNPDSAFVFFCRKGYVKKAIKKRIKKCRKRLELLGDKRADTATIKFLDGNKIADWVNSHAAAFTFVQRAARNLQSTAFFDFSYWKGYPFFQNEFHSSAKIDTIIATIRSELSKPSKIVRITGASGLGKTRLAFEVFNRIINSDDEDERDLRESLAGAAFYVDIEEGDRDFIPTIKQLSAMGYSGVAIVDNCPRTLHYSLADTISHSDNKLSILTVDYELDPPQPDPLRIQLNWETMEEVVPEILKAVPGLRERLTDAGIERVAAFAHGFPQMAILAAQAEQALDYDGLNENELADRLLWGRSDEDKEAKLFLRAASVFTSVGVAGKHSAQLKFLIKELCGDVGEERFNTATSRFRKNRILQRAGDFIMVAPPPLAVALAADWIDDIPDDRLESLLPLIEKAGLVGAFCGRLRRLDFSERATALADRLLCEPAPFSQAEVLNSEVGSQIFRALLELNPLAANRALIGAFGDWPIDQLRTELVAGRRNIVWALQKLCWEPDLFPEAAGLLRKLAAAENEHWANNSEAMFKQLFHLHLSGTKTPALDRLGVIEDGLEHDNPAVVQVCIDALAAGLTSDRFSRSSGPEVRGSRPPERDWQPRIYRDAWDYWKRIFQMLSELILESGAYTERATSELGQKLRGILLCPLRDELKEQFMNLAAFREGLWPEARESIRHVLDYEEGLTDEGRSVLQEWLSAVTPDGLEQRLVDTISTPGWDHKENSEGGWRDVSEEKATALADELYRDGIDWVEFLPSLLQGGQHQAWSFGIRVMELCSSQDELIHSAIESFRNLESDVRNPQLIRGMCRAIRGTELCDQVLEEVASDDTLLGDLLLPLTTAGGSTVADLKRVSQRILAGKLPPSAIENLAFGGATDNYDSEELSSALEDLRTQKPEAAPFILHIVHLYCLRNEERQKVLTPLVLRLLPMQEMVASLDRGQIGHDWFEWVDAALSGTPPEGFVEALATAVLGDPEIYEITFSQNDYISLAISRLMSLQPERAWPVFDVALRNAEGELRYPVVSLLGKAGARFDLSGRPIGEFSPEELKTWAEGKLDLLDAIYDRINLFELKLPPAKPAESADAEDEKETEEKGIKIPSAFEDEVPELKPGECYVWRPIAAMLVELLGRKKITAGLSSHLLCFGSSGSRVPYLLRRRVILEHLIEDGDRELAQIAKAVLRDVDATIEREKKEDEQHAAGIYAP